MKTFIIGIGAAGNKAAIQAVKTNILAQENVLLVNSTMKDIPAEFRENALIIGDGLNGCGKERHLSKDAIVNKMKNDSVFDTLLDTSNTRVIIATSTEGGTGSGSAPILARYFRDAIGANSSIFAFTGFETDARGMKNTIDFFKELDEETNIQIISNKKFLNEANGSYPKAQELANYEFCRRIQIMSGNILVNSDQNIDDTDLHKLVDASGLLDIEYHEIDKIKNTNDFNNLCTLVADESKSLDFEPTATRIGVILNIKEKTKDAVDYSFGAIKNKFGEAYEIFTHIQNVDVSGFEKEFIAIIASGIKMPLESVQETYDSYIKANNKVSKDKDSFFSTIGKMESEEEDDTFNMKLKSTVNKSDFFNSL